MRNKLKVYRAMHDLTQEELATRLDVTRQTIISIEKGKYDPSLELAFRIAVSFQATIEDIFFYGERIKQALFSPFGTPQLLFLTNIML
jgi:putative transcriptional regulator